MGRWSVHEAPPRSDIDWMNLTYTREQRCMSRFVINLALVLFCILFTAPVALLDKFIPLYDHEDSVLQ